VPQSGSRQERLDNYFLRFVVEETISTIFGSWCFDEVHGNRLCRVDADQPCENVLVSSTFLWLSVKEIVYHCSQDLEKTTTCFLKRHDLLVIGLLCSRYVLPSKTFTLLASLFLDSNVDATVPYTTSTINTKNVVLGLEFEPIPYKRS
jgi:hypothetical protein